MLAPVAPFLRQDSVTYEGVTLPVKKLRTGGIHFQDDATFLSSAEKEAKRLQEAFGISPKSRILDVGCGFGRLPIGLTRTIGNPEYIGADVNLTAVRWCRRHIGKKYPTYRFLHLPIRNERYNPTGIPFDEKFRFPWTAECFDAIYLYSVFSHMRSADISIYLREFARLLKPTGGVFLTAFVEENVPEEEENPAYYRASWKGALHCVRFERSFFESLVHTARLKIDRYDYEAETDGQSGIYLKKA